MPRPRDNFIDEGLQAIANYHLIGKQVTPHSRFAHAEAGTGSRYEVFAVLHPEERFWLVGILSPWNSCYPIPEGSHLTPEYFLAKFHPGVAWHNIHGGDTAALMRTVADLTLSGYHWE